MALLSEKLGPMDRTMTVAKYLFFNLMSHVLLDPRSEIHTPCFVSLAQSQYGSSLVPTSFHPSPCYYFNSAEDFGDGQCN